MRYNDLADNRHISLNAPFTKTVAVVLLLMQVCFASAHGRMICIQVGHSGQREAASGSAARESGGTHDCGHQHHSPIVPAEHDEDSCQCHVHVPLPNEPRPSQPHQYERELHVLIVPAALLAIVVCAGVERGALGAGWRPPDPQQHSRVRALKATRLLL